MKNSNFMEMILVGVSRRSLIAVLLVGAIQFVAGCKSIPNESFYCRDEKNKPVEGVLVVCRYSGSTWMGSFTAGADYRFSDDHGVAFFGPNEVSRKLHPRTQFRGIAYVYSKALRSGGMVGGVYDANKLESVFTAYDTPEPGVILFRDNRRDPEVWFGVLYYLTVETKHAKRGEWGYTKHADFPVVGVDRLADMLDPFVENEWADFFKQYGNEPIPLAYFNKWFASELRRIPLNKETRFNDLKPIVEKIIY